MTPARVSLSVAHMAPERFMLTLTLKEWKRGAWRNEKLVYSVESSLDDLFLRIWGLVRDALELQELMEGLPELGRAELLQEAMQERVGTSGNDEPGPF